MRAARGATQNIASWILLCAFLLLTGLANGVYGAVGEDPSGIYRLLTTVGAVVFLWQWFSRQVAPYRSAWPPDMGLFIASFWFVAMPCYLWRYERWRGLFKVALVLGMYLSSWVLGVLVWLVLR